MIDEEDGVFGGDGLEEVHHEFLLAGPGIGEEEVDFVGIEAVVGGGGVDGLLGICFWRKVREERIWAEYMGEKGGWSA